MAKVQSNTPNPFNKGGKIHDVFEMAKKGTTREAIKAFAEKNELGAARLFHCMRLGGYPINQPTVTWEYTESEGDIQLESVKAVAVKKTPATAKAAVSAKSKAKGSKAA